MTRTAVASATLAFALVAAAPGLTACSNPPLSIELAILSGSDQTCESTSCSGIPVTCETMLFVQILDPSRPDQPYLSQCLPVLQTSHDDLCPVAGVQLSPDGSDGHPITLPEETLEVEVVVLPFLAGSDGLPDCAPGVAGLQFAEATGLPEAIAADPPIGGRAYYHPGDAVTVVELGCNDLVPLNDCTVSNSIAVDATVDEFSTDLPVTAMLANNVVVSVGEPTAMAVGSGTEYMLPTSATHELALTATTPTPAWSGTVEQTFQVATCIEVVENNAETTPTLACTPAVPGATTIDFDGKSAPAGIHLSVDTLNAMVAALDDPTFTLDEGLVLGIVLDANGSPVANVTVAASDPNATIGYLTANSLSFSGPATSTTGIFASTNAAFATDGLTLTSWTAEQGATLVTTGYGGLVNGMVTIVVLQFPPTTHS